MKKRLLCVAILFFIVKSVCSQSFVLTGCVKDSLNASLGFATIGLLSTTDSVAVNGAVAGKDGRYRIENIPSGNYLVRFSFIGYEEQIIPIKMTRNTVLPDVKLALADVALKEVVVKGDFIRQKGDRYIANIQNTQLALGKNTLEVLNSLPGVSTRNGMKINGRKVVKVYINKREITDMGELEAISAEDIKQIEVVPTVGSNFMDVDGGALYVTLRRQEGVFGSIYNYNTTREDAWFSEKLNGTVNFQKKKLSIYNYLNGDYTRYVSMFEKRMEYNDGKVVHGCNPQKLPMYTLSDQLSFVYELTPKHTLYAAGGVRANWAKKYNDNEYQLPVTNEIDRSYIRGNSNGLSSVASLGYVYQEKADYLQILAYYNHEKSKEDQGIQRYYGNSSNPEQFAAWQDTTWFRSNRFSVYADYVRQMNEHTKLDAGLLYITSKTNVDYNSQKAFDQAGYLFNGTGSSTGGYASYMVYYPRWYVSAGVRYQWDVKRYKLQQMEISHTTYRGFYPTLRGKYVLVSDKNTSISGSYAFYRNYPNYGYYLPIIDRISNLQYSTGNPYLQAMKEHLGQLSLNIRNRFVIAYNLRYTDHQIRVMSFIDEQNPEII